MRSKSHCIAFAFAFALLLSACTSDAPGPRSSTGDGAARDVGDALPPTGPSGKEGRRGDTGAFVRHVWYDGDDEREAWLDPDFVADHAPSEESTRELRARAPFAEEVASEAPRPRVWRLGAGAPDAAALCAALRGARAESRFSPVFRSAPDASATSMSLPGGVVVAFAESWTSAAASAWLAARGLSVERELALGAPAFVVASEAGLPALSLANELHAAPEVRWAQPDWWLELRGR